MFWVGVELGAAPSSSWHTVIYYDLNDKAPRNVQAIGLAHWLKVQTAIFRKEMSVCAILDGLIPFLLRGQGIFPYHMVLMLPLCSVLFKCRSECHKILLIRGETKFSTPFAESPERGWQDKSSPNFACSLKRLRTRIFCVPTFSRGGSVMIIYEEQN